MRSFTASTRRGDGLTEVQGTAVQRVMGSCGQDVWRAGLKTRSEMERRMARPVWLCSDAALRR